MKAGLIGMAVALCGLSASAQTARDVRGATPLVAIENEAPPKLIVDPIVWIQGFGLARTCLSLGDEDVELSA